MSSRLLLSAEAVWARDNVLVSRLYFLRIIGLELQRRLTTIKPSFPSRAPCIYLHMQWISVRAMHTLAVIAGTAAWDSYVQVDDVETIGSADVSCLSAVPEL